MLPDAGDALLVEQERLDRRARACARARAGARPVNSSPERLDAEPRGEERVERVVRRARARRCRSGAGRRTAARWSSRPKPHARVRRALGRVEQQRAGHAQVQEQVDLVLDSSQTRYLPRRPSALDPTRPATAAASSARRERARTSARRGPRAPSASRPSTWGARWRRIVSTSGSSGMAPLRLAAQPAAQVGVEPAQRDRQRAPDGATGGVEAGAPAQRLVVERVVELEQRARPNRSASRTTPPTSPRRRPPAPSPLRRAIASGRESAPDAAPAGRGRSPRPASSARRRRRGGRRTTYIAMPSTSHAGVRPEVAPARAPRA